MSRSRPNTPETTGLTDEESLNLLQTTTLGRIISPFIQATARLNVGDGNGGEAPFDLERMARRVVAHERVGAYNNMARTPHHFEPDIEGVVRKQLLELAMPDTSQQRLMVEAPTEFSPCPVLVNNDKVQVLKINFTSLSMKSKFSGRKNPTQHGEMDVIALLTSLTRGQKVMNLSRTEFLSQLVNSCSGDPHTLASEYLRLEEEGEMSVASIYLRFTDSYFYDLRPEQAMARLQEVTSGKSKYSSLSEAEMEVKKLCRLTALNGSSLKDRQMLELMNFKKYFLKIIPDKFLSVIIQAIDRVEALERRDITIDEMIIVARKYRFEIDSVLYNRSRQKGANAGVNQAPDALHTCHKKGLTY